MTLEQILNLLTHRGVECDYTGAMSDEIHQVASLGQAGVHELTFFNDPKRKRELKQTQAGCVLIRPVDAELTTRPKLLVSDPYYAYALVAQALNKRSFPAETHSSAQIAPSAILGANVFVGANVCVGENAVIEDDCVIEAGAIIQSNVFIGRGSYVGANVTLADAVVVGADVYLDAGCVIGGQGFGFAPHQGQWHRIPQIGRVVIGDRVFIGNNTTVHRGALEDTVISDDCIIDAQVQVAHNVKLGQGVAVAAQSGFAGSTEVGAHCQFGGQSGVSGHLSISDGVFVGAKAGVTHSLKQSGAYAGFPATDAASWQKNMVRVKSLDKMASRIKVLEKELSALKAYLEKDI
ncbi:UDP-3-O-(3-hydroxymyristoyl)glucosamine N-acyltransferase [Thiomicrospira sp. WB1]|uniref:UDP-3-O-(3-hydroxymyristoyl)glucosamine N-acyltransferase n=1 Tax=Thiomicrospira sp. WB1 TaxID=1685380 RepID=UPI0007464313|nr:UDP-3-O-(3-hydroxymyristoyl)glucosamine N-acyltransferase [Thiomicrospira sp. WB1]KUJ72097.1 UDP-3-O-(3-hydroxymyristoyl)glucosamine N-acyltransferase [Thiomicrospira sp. WB1]